MLVTTDSEFQKLNRKIALPFATTILCNESYYADLGPKQKKYKGYDELSYLDPRYFKPNVNVISRLGLRPREYVILRLSDWNTLHDLGANGLGREVFNLVKSMDEQYRVFIMPEGELDSDLEPYRLKIPADQFHDVLAFARLVITEGASTASEAACLGVPSIYINSTDRGYLTHQAEVYGLVHDFRTPKGVLECAKGLLEGSFEEARYAKSNKVC